MNEGAWIARVGYFESLWDLYNHVYTSTYSLDEAQAGGFHQ